MIKKRLAKKALSADYYTVWVNDDYGIDSVTIPRNPRCLNIIYRACARHHWSGYAQDIEEQLTTLGKWLDED